MPGSEEVFLQSVMVNLTVFYIVLFQHAVRPTMSLSLSVFSLLPRLIIRHPPIPPHTRPIARDSRRPGDVCLPSLASVDGDRRVATNPQLLVARDHVDHALQIDHSSGVDDHRLGPASARAEESSIHRPRHLHADRAADPNVRCAMPAECGSHAPFFGHSSSPAATHDDTHSVVFGLIEIRNAFDYSSIAAAKVSLLLDGSAGHNRSGEGRISIDNDGEGFGRSSSDNGDGAAAASSRKQGPRSPFSLSSASSTVGVQEQRCAPSLLNGSYLSPSSSSSSASTFCAPRSRGRRDEDNEGSQQASAEMQMSMSTERTSAVRRSTVGEPSLFNVDAMFGTPASAFDVALPIGGGGAADNVNSGRGLRRRKSSLITPMR